MTVFSYELEERACTHIAVVVLKSDETIERDLYTMKGINTDLLVTRVLSEAEVTGENLQKMVDHIGTSVSLLPDRLTMAATGYGCTSGTAQIGARNIADLITKNSKTRAVTEPVSALIAACQHLGLRRIAFLSPYIEQVSNHLRDTLARGGVDTPAFGTFAEAQEKNVTRISAHSIMQAAQELTKGSGVDGLFLSCTNLRTMDVIEGLEAQLNIPVLSSNQVLAWHLGQLAGDDTAFRGPGRLFGCNNLVKQG